MASRPAVSLRLGMDGKEAVEKGFEDIGKAGEAAGRRAADAFDRASQDIAAATQRQAQAAQKLAAFAPGVSLGSERQGPSTSMFRQYQQDLADAQRKAEALRNAIEPLRVAQQTYDREIGVADDLLGRKIITEDEHTRAVRRSAESLEEQRRANMAGAANDNARKFAIQGAGFQFQDFIVQVNGGTSAIRAFGQQFPQLAPNLEAFGGTVGKIGAFLNGPWGIALTLAITVAAGLADAMLNGADAAGKEEDAALTLTGAIDKLNQATGAGHKTRQQQIDDAYATAKALYNQELQTRSLLKVQLELARGRAQEGASNTQLVMGGPGAAEARVAALRDVAALNKQIADQDAALRGARQGFRGAIADRQVSRSELRGDAAATARDTYEQRVSTLRQQAMRGEIKTSAELDAAIDRARTTRDAAVKAAEDGGKRVRASHDGTAKAAREAAAEERRERKDRARLDYHGHQLHCRRFLFTCRPYIYPTKYGRATRLEAERLGEALKAWVTVDRRAAEVGAERLLDIVGAGIAPGGHVSAANV